MDMTKATLDRKEAERQSHDLSSMPPPPSPIVRQRHASTPNVFNDDNLVDCQAIPHHLFSPSRQHQFINRDQAQDRPTYQDIIDYPSPKSVDSNNLDMFAPSPSYSAPPSSPLAPGSGERRLLPPPDLQLSQIQVNTVNVINPGNSSLSSTKQSSKPQPETTDGENNVEILEEGNLNELLDKDASLKDIQPARANNVAKQNIMKTLQDWDNPSSDPTPPKNASTGPWRPNSELPTSPFYPSVSVKNDAQTREMVFGKKCDVISLQLKPLLNEDNSGDDQTLKRKSDELESSEIVKKPRRTFCKKCGASLRTLSDIKNHPCNPEVDCEDCLPKKTTLANKNVLREHLRLMHPHRGEKHKCSECEKSFQHKTLLSLHFKAKHQCEDQEQQSQPSADSDPLPGPSSSEKPPSSESQPPLEAEQEKEVEVESVVAVDTSTQAQVTELLAPTVSESKKGAEVPLCLLEEDIDAPGSVATVAEKQFRCVRCDKRFHTAVRYNNHKKNCQPGKGPAVNVKPVARYVVGQSSWGDLITAKQRCAQCGRDNYQQETLAKHLPRCRGTLINNRGKRYQCFYCREPKRTFDTENSMRRHVSTYHSKEAVEDEWDYGSIPVKTVGLAANHLFR